jgi:hypothetical protein
MEKFTIDIRGYGAEITIGRLTDEQVENIKNYDGDLNDLVFDDDALGAYWAEIDDIYHNFNVGDVFTITITDEDGNELYQFNDDDIIYNDESPIEIEYDDKYNDTEEPCLVCCSGEKGSFFEAYIEAEEFDISKLKIVIHEDVGVHNCYNFGNMIGNIYYDGEELDNYGGSTDGKSFDVSINFTK